MGIGNLAKLINSNMAITPEKKFLREFNKTIEELDENRAPSKTYAPSSMGGCMRLMYFKVTGAECDPPSGDSILAGICESGTDRHVRLQTWVTRMKEAGYDWEWIDVGEYLKEHPVKGTYISNKSGMETHCKNKILNLSFMTDGIIKYEGDYYILEIKTESVYKYQSQTGPFPEHLVQATCYSTGLGIDKVIFLYEDRNLCNKKCYLVDITDEMKQDLVVGKIQTVEQFKKDGITPPKSTNLKDCTYCSYKKICGMY